MLKISVPCISRLKRYHTRCSNGSRPIQSRFHGSRFLSSRYFSRRKSLKLFLFAINASILEKSKKIFKILEKKLRHSYFFVSGVEKCQKIDACVTMSENGCVFRFTLWYSFTWAKSNSDFFSH